MPRNRLFLSIPFLIAAALCACASPDAETQNRAPLRFDLRSVEENSNNDQNINAAAIFDSIAEENSNGDPDSEPDALPENHAGAISKRGNANCRSLCNLGKIRIEDPTRIASYDPEQLGIVALCGEDAHNPQCVDDALRDGAVVLPSDGGNVLLLYPTRLEAFLDAQSARIDMPAMEGRWSESLDRVIPGVGGRRVSREKTFENLKNTLLNGGDSFEIAIDALPAASSNPDDFAGFRPTHRIGSFRTKFNRSKNRTHNVKLAASAVDGLFLMPGAEFSYNDWVGERSEARGFREAPVIEQGQLVEGLGGGACQVSSTIHAAALLAGLAIPERYNHSLPSSYIPMGMDAVVSYPVLDLRIKNNFDRPVVLRVSIEDTTLIAEFYSDFERDSKVYFRHETAAEIPYKEIISVDPALPPQTVKITKRGKPGYRILRSRITLKDGKEYFEKLSDDTYQPQTQRVSVAQDAVYPPPDDQNPTNG